MMRFAGCASACVMAAAMLSPASAGAQTQDRPTKPAASAADPAASAGDTEIIVTASKRGTQTVQSAPLSIQAISGDTLRAKGAIDFIDFGTTVSSLQFQDLGPGDKKYIIRGVTSTGAATVGVYYDEAVITAANANDGGGRNADIRLLDLERIEVLKGPQGTLYGASSMSGTIRYISNKPNLKEFSATVAGEVSTTEKGGPNYLLWTALNAPLVTDRLGIRLVGWYDDKSGYVDAVRIPAGRRNDLNNDLTGGGRALIRAVPIDDLVLTASATIQSTRSEGSSRYTPPGALSFGNAAAGFPPVRGDDLINTDLALSPWRELLHIYGFTAEYSTSIGTFTGTTNYYDRKIDYSFDSSPILFFFGVPIPAVTLQPQSRSVWSSEIRFASKLRGPINFVLGGFVQYEDSQFEVQVIKTDRFGNPIGRFSRLNADDALNNPNGNTFFGRTDKQTLDQQAVFGEITADVTRTLSATFGIRYFHSDNRAAQETTHPFGGFTSSPVGVQFNQSDDSKTTFKGNITWKPSRSLLVYATAAQGFRVGGVNAANLPFTSDIPRSYKPDTLWNYEIGVKSTILNGIHANVTGYYIDWTDTQVRAVDRTGAFPFTTNAGKVNIYGIEGELDGEIVRNLTFTAAASYQDATLGADTPFIPGNPNQGLKGDTLPNVPAFQGSAALSYKVPLRQKLDGVFRVDANYRGPTQTQYSSRSPFNVRLDDYALVNLRASLVGNGWSAALFVRNVTDVRAQIDAIASDQDPLARITLRPRTWGLALSRDF